MPRRLLLILPAVVALTLALAPMAGAGIPSANTAWTWQSPLPTGDQLGSGAYRAGTELWTVSLSRGFLRSTDEGATWSAVRVGPSLGFNDVAFGDAQHGVAVGETSNAWDLTGHGLIWRTSDGGTSWHPASGSTASPLAQVAFAGPFDAWAVGRFGAVLHSADGGATWTPQTAPAEAQGIDLTGVSFVDTQHGWIVGCEPGSGESYVLSTVNGGATWSTADVIGGSFLYICDFIDTQNGWAAGTSGMIWHTSDGGATWMPQQLPNANFYTSILSLDFANGTTGWAVSNQGRIYGTQNAGAAWAIQKTVEAASLRGVTMRDATHGVITGDDGVVLRTGDGVTWTEVSSGARAPLIDISAIGASKAWAVGFNGQILSTANGGEKWTAKKKVTSKHLTGVDFVNGQQGWAVGRRGLVLHTTNGGGTWKTQPSHTKTDLDAVDFVTSVKGWTAGSGGAIFATTDGGATWKRQATPTQADLSDVRFVDALHGWACASENGIVLRTTDGGKHWTKSQARVLPWRGGPLWKISFIDRKRGWLCGEVPAGDDTLGAIFATTDGGATWSVRVPTREFTLPEQAVAGIDFVDKNHGWAVGEHGLYLYTTDGGHTWALPARLAPDETLLDVEFVNGTVGYVTGTGGTILKTTTSGR